MLLALLLGGCGKDGKERKGDAFVLEDVNILMIVVDTMGTRHLGAWNEGLDTSPTIDALAAEGIRFTRASSPTPWTQPAVASMMTGLTPSHHGVLHLFDKLPEDKLTLAEALQARGYKTAGVISHFLINRERGYAQGFDVYDEGAVAGHTEVSSPKVTRTAISELKRLKDERFFLFVHYFDPHSEYLHHPQYDRTSGYDGPARQWGRDIVSLRAERHHMTPADVDFLSGLYREEIRYTDHHIGLLMAQLDKLGLKENTLVILTADHGEEFMEHDWIGHTKFLYDTLLHVPLVFRLPGRLAPGTVAAPVSLNDLMPTLLGMSHISPKDAGWDGRSLEPYLRGGKAPADVPEFAEVCFLSPPEEQGTVVAEKQAFLSAVRLDGWKLIHDLDLQGWSLFNLADDPLEMNNLYAADHPQVGRLQPLLLGWEVDKVEKWGRDFEGMQQMSEEDRKKLRSLGYVR